MEVTNHHLTNRRSSNVCSVESESKCMDGCSSSYRTHCGLCCVCHTLPTHSRTYYGHMFCIECFHKYIWSPSKHDCSGDVSRSQASK